jgi:hypothetical protein
MAAALHAVSDALTARPRRSPLPEAPEAQGGEPLGRFGGQGRRVVDDALDGRGEPRFDQVALSGVADRVGVVMTDARRETGSGTGNGRVDLRHRQT